MADKKELKKFNKIVDSIDSLEPKFESMSDKELKDMTNVFKERLANGETLDDILPEAFAVVREASKRVLGMRHYRVQLIGGIVLHQGTSGYLFPFFLYDISVLFPTFFTFASLSGG